MPHTHRERIHFLKQPSRANSGAEFRGKLSVWKPGKDAGEENVHIPENNSQTSKRRETQPWEVPVSGSKPERPRVASPVLPAPPASSSCSPSSGGSWSLGLSQDPHPLRQIPRSFHFQRDRGGPLSRVFSPGSRGWVCVSPASGTLGGTPFPPFVCEVAAVDLIAGECCDYLMVSQTAPAGRIKFHICFGGVNLSPHTPPVMMCTREIMFKRTKAK